MDITQIILASAVLILTIILSLVGFEVFLIFREFRRSFKKINKIIDDVGLVSELAVRQLSGVSNVMNVVQAVAGLIKTFIKKEENFLPESESTFVSPLRRFFTRGGKKLS